MRGRLRHRWIAGATPVALLLGTAAGLPTPAAADVVTVQNDNMRTAWDQNEPGLSPSSVSASDFGQLFSTQLNGQVYAEQLVVKSTLIAVTENNYIYGLNPATGAIIWSRNVGAAWPSSVLGCGDLTPNLGITSTPVYDSATGSVFFVAKVNDGPDLQHPNWYMHSIDPVTGAERSGWPVKIQGHPSNDPTRTFDAETAGQRAGLLDLDGVIYVAFASHCDYGSYVGTVAGVNTTTPTMSTIWSAEAGTANGEAGIWQSGGGLVSDGPGRIILTTGNGLSPAPGPGNAPPANLAESVVRLQVNGDGSLTAKDFFSPSNNTNLDQDDVDFGSGGPLALPDQFGTTAHPHLLVQMGKDGRVFLLDRDNLGGNAQGPGGTDASVGAPIGPFGGMWGHFALWGGDGGYVYDIENGSYVRALKIGVNGSGLPTLSSVGHTNELYGFTSGSPVVTSTGTTSGSAVVWEVYASGSSGANGVLRAYDAVPQNGILHLRWSFPIGTASKFTTPATDSGRVYIGTRDGKVMAFGRPTTSSLTGSPTDFGNVALGSTGHATVTVTAARAVTVTGIAAAAPFSVTPPTLPVSLAAGATLSVPASFTPTATGGATGSITFTTSAGTVPFDLHGTGTQTGLGATPTALAFGTVPTGANQTTSVTIANTGTASLTISGATGPTGDFSATGLPATGSTLAPGASISIAVTFTPTADGDESSSLSVTSAAGSVTVPITGTGVTGASHMSITPNPLDFGAVALGSSVTKTFTISNTGNIQLTLTKAAPPAGEFTTATPVAEGQMLSPGDSVVQSITFKPTVLGADTEQYSITSTDGQGPVLEKFTGTGVASGTVAIPDPTTWHLNGSTVVNGSDLVLTPATANKAGDAIYPTAVPTNGLHVHFTAQLNGGTGGDGLTMAFLDPTKGATATSLGTTGDGLGFGSLPGVAVALDTHQNGTDPSGNFAGITDKGTPAPTYNNFTWANFQGQGSSLRTGTHSVDITVNGLQLAVSIDGATPFKATMTHLPPSALLAFTAGTGTGTDTQLVRNVTITTPSSGAPPSTVTLPAPTAAGWVRNGTAVLAGADLMLTKAGQAHSSGSSFYTTPVPTTAIHATFTESIMNGGGQDGETFTMIDASKGDTSGLGLDDGGLGFVNIPGIAVAMDTNQDTGEPSANFIGIATGNNSSGLPAYQVTSSDIPNLRWQTNIINVDVVNGKVSVSVNGVLKLSLAVTLPSQVYVGFTASSDVHTDDHVIRGATITAQE
jgi:Abnormal spindle-like microcephaly-assoc'd, ASPM-SPD-2-Hydin/PQQ-like domain